MPSPGSAQNPELIPVLTNIVIMHINLQSNRHFRFYKCSKYYPDSEDDNLNKFEDELENTTFKNGKICFVCNMELLFQTMKINVCFNKTHQRF